MAVTDSGLLVQHDSNPGRKADGTWESRFHTENMLTLKWSSPVWTNSGSSFPENRGGRDWEGGRENRWNCMSAVMSNDCKEKCQPECPTYTEARPGQFFSSMTPQLRQGDVWFLNEVKCSLPCPEDLFILLLYFLCSSLFGTPKIESWSFLYETFPFPHSLAGFCLSGTVMPNRIG